MQIIWYVLASLPRHAQLSKGKVKSLSLSLSVPHSIKETPACNSKDVDQCSRERETSRLRFNFEALIHKIDTFCEVESPIYYDDEQINAI